MKIATQVTASLLSLGSLLGMAASSHATDIANLPLKASVLAKPNVIFGLDDSGSMDWEVLLDTSSGLFWWDGDDGWNAATGKPASATGSNNDIRSYLFPVGRNAGGQLYSHDSIYGRALPPTNQFAWLRSNKFNPVYYDSKATYKPWSPAHLDGVDLPAYPDANADAALSHPLYPAGPTLKLNASWDATAANWTSDGYRFRLQAGMTVPAGSQLNADSAISGACNGGVSQTLTAQLTVAAGSACYASIAYYPATFWQAENCALGADCVLGPDGVTKLRRYEIKPATAGYPSGRGYVEEMRNFANWFTYYRKRKLMLAGSMGQVLEGLTGLRLGVVPFNQHAAVTMRDTDDTLASKNGREITGRFYKNALDAEGTPTHATVKYIAGQFNTNAAVVEYACQRNSMFVLTDGFSNTTSIATPAWDDGKSENTWGKTPAPASSTSPYQSIPGGSLSDLALRYYTNRLRAGDRVAGMVPISDSNADNADKNPDLHINTYAITLGVRGSLWPNTVDPFKVAPVWPVPVADDPSLIDDQWHATINGRGLMFLATTPDETVDGIRKVFDDIKRDVGAQGGIAVSTVNLPRGESMAYFGGYDPSGWAGDLTGNEINRETGKVTKTIVDMAANTVTPDKGWSAALKLKLRDWTTRIVATSSGAAGPAIDFTAANVGATVNPGEKYGAHAAVIDYLRGDTSRENTDFRRRISLMGAVISSEPAVARDDKVVYVASGEGMLHAFDTSAGNEGKELWAFVPSEVLPDIGKTVQRGYAFQTQYDGSPILGKFSAAGKLLVSGMGAAGRGYFALDVSNPRVAAANQLKVKWEFTGAKLGQTLGRPVFAKTDDGKYVVLVTSGYNVADNKGYLWMLDATDGSVLHEFEVPAGASEAGLAHVVAFGESTGTVQYVYGGDLLGNVWRFDLKGKGAPLKVATLVGPDGQAQPVTAAPELLNHEGRRVIFVGTGRLLGISDFGSSKVQSIYAISDGATLVNARDSLVKQTYNRATDTMSENKVDWDIKRGWYVDLKAGEQINTRPTLAYGGLAFVSNVNGETDCSASSYLYVVDAKSGTKFVGTDFVSTLVSKTSNSSGVTALLTTGQKIIGAGQDADGKPWERQITSGSPIKPGKNAWIEIRRQ